MSGIWISDSADRIDDGDAMALNHAVLQAAIHGHGLDGSLIELLRSDHEIHRDVRDALVRLIDASGDNSQPVALKVECREKSVTGQATRSGKALYEERTRWIKMVRDRAEGESWAAWARGLGISEGAAKERRKYAEPILAQIRDLAPQMAERMRLGLPATERMLQDKLVWESIGAQKAAHKERNQTRKARRAGG